MCPMNTSMISHMHVETFVLCSAVLCCSPDICRHHRLQYFFYVLTSGDTLHINFLVCCLDLLKFGTMFLPHGHSLSQIHLQMSRGKKKGCTAVLQLLPYKTLGLL